MNMNTIWQLWIALGTCHLYVMLNSTLYLTGAGIQLPILQFTFQDPEQINLFAVPIGATFLTAMIWLGKIYCRSSTGPSVASTLPGPRGADASTPEGRAIRIWATIVFLVVPMLLFINFLVQFFMNPVYERGNEQLFADGFVEFLTHYAPFENDGYRYHKVSGFTFFPFWQPWIYLIFALCTGAYFATYLREIFRHCTR